MSTKDLSRTALEGGRVEYCKFHVTKFERSLRTSNRRVRVRVQRAVDPDDHVWPTQQSFPRRGSQTDKLSPLYRFLDSRVGRPWAKVRSEAHQKFDSRTLAGRHILYDHLLKEVDPHAHIPTGEVWSYYRDYFVDDGGILRKKPPRYVRKKTPLVFDSTASYVCNWLGSRGIIRIDRKLFWAVPTERTLLVWEKRTGAGLTYESNGNRLNYATNLRYALWRLDEGTPITWGRGKALSAAETIYFKTLPDWVRAALVVQPGTVTLKRAA